MENEGGRIQWENNDEKKATAGGGVDEKIDYGEESRGVGKTAGES